MPSKPFVEYVEKNVKLVTEHHDYGLKIKIKVLPKDAEQTLNDAEDLSPAEQQDCQHCHQLSQWCDETPVCYRLQQCMQDTIHLRDSLDSLAQLSPGTYLNATVAATKCAVYDAKAWHTFLNMINVQHEVSRRA